MQGEGRVGGVGVPRPLLLPPLPPLLRFLPRARRPLRQHRTQDLATAQAADGHEDQVRVAAGLPSSQRRHGRHERSRRHAAGSRQALRGADEVPADPAQERRRHAPADGPHAQLPAEEAGGVQPEAHYFHHVPHDADLRGELPPLHRRQHHVGGLAGRPAGRGRGRGLQSSSGTVSQVFSHQQRRQPFHLRVLQPALQEGVREAVAGLQMQGAGCRDGGHV